MTQRGLSDVFCAIRSSAARPSEWVRSLVSITRAFNSGGGAPPLFAELHGWNPGELFGREIAVCAGHQPQSGASNRRVQVVTESIAVAALEAQLPPLPLPRAD